MSQHLVNQPLSQASLSLTVLQYEEQAQDIDSFAKSEAEWITLGTKLGAHHANRTKAITTVLCEALKCVEAAGERQPDIGVIAGWMHELTHTLQTFAEDSVFIGYDPLLAQTLVENVARHTRMALDALDDGSRVDCLAELLHSARFNNGLPLDLNTTLALLAAQALCLRWKVPLMRFSVQDHALLRDTNQTLAQLQTLCIDRYTERVRIDAKSSALRIGGYSSSAMYQREGEPVFVVKWNDL
jgi:hypothetical protein